MAKYYTGIGSRKTPIEILNVFEYLGEQLAIRGYILRSGGADGSDKAFEKGCTRLNGKKEIFLPWKYFNKNLSDHYYISEEAYKIANQFHPCFYRLSSGAKKLIARDGYQVLGQNLDTLSEFVICYTEKGKGNGGTGQAIRIANYYGIKVYDFGIYPLNNIMDIVNEILSNIDNRIIVNPLSFYNK